MRWASNQSCVTDTDGLLAMDWNALGLLIQQQAYEAMACHLHTELEHRCAVSTYETLADRDI